MAEEDEIAEDRNAEGDYDEEGGAGKSSKINKKLLFILIPVLLIIGTAVGMYLIGAMDSMFDKAEEEPTEVALTEEGQVPQSVVFYDLPNILVNINTKSKKNTFLKVSIALELASEADRAKLTTLEPRIIDNFQVYLRELRIDELQGSAGMYRLKEELMSRVNQAISPAKVNDVLFKEMLIQ